MKVLIVNPPSHKDKGYIREGRCEQRLSSFQYVMVPISLPAIAAVLLKANFEVKILDCITNNISNKNLKKHILDFQPELIIFNIATATYFTDLYSIELIKTYCNAHITGIGVHVTALPEEVLTHSKIDSVIRGEPEITSLELAKALEQNLPLELVDGISFKKNSMIIHNRPREFIKNLDKLPFPARHLLNNEKYVLPVVNKPYTLIVPSRGCPYDCIFCTAHLYYGRVLRTRSISNIIEELKEIIYKYRILYVTMWSDTFTLNRDFVVDICKAIKSSNLNFYWMCNSRVDTVDPELLKLMKSAGCIGISYGVESGDQTILDNIKKRITVKDIENAFRWTKAAGIETLAHFIFGLPGETEESIERTIKIAKKIDPDYAQFYCAIPFPGTELYYQAQKNKWLTTNDWSKYEINQPILNLPTLPNTQLRKARIKAYKKFYFRPYYFFSRLKKINSVKELMLTIKQAVNFAKEWVL